MSGVGTCIRSRWQRNKKGLRRVLLGAGALSAACYHPPPFYGRYLAVVGTIGAPNLSIMWPIRSRWPAVGAEECKNTVVEELPNERLTRLGSGWNMGAGFDREDGVTDKLHC